MIMKQADAKKMILKAFDEWRVRQGLHTPNKRDALAFYADIQKDQPHLLDFRCSYDKWQKVKDWLIQAERVSD